MESGVDRVMKDDDVAAVDGNCGKERAGTVWGGGLLVDEEEVAYKEGGLHRFGGDAERLNAEGDDEDGDDDEVQKGLKRDEDAGPVVMRRTVTLKGRGVRGPRA